MKSLKTKLVLFVSLILSVSMILVSIISYAYSSNMLKERLGEEHFLKAREASLELDVFLQQQKSLFDSVAAVDNKFFGNHEVFMEHMAILMKRFPEYLLMSFSFDKDGKQVYIHSGVVIDASNLAYVKRVMTEKQAIVSDPIISKSTGKPCVVAVAPLYNKSGEAHGFLGGCIEFGDALKKVTQAKFGETGYAVLVDTQGRFLYHPNKEWVMNKTVYDVNNPNLVSMFEKVKKGEHSKVEFDENGVKMLATYAPTESGWGIFTITPMKEVYKPVVSLFAILMGASGVILLVGLILTYLIANGIVKPIEKLNKLVSLIAKGELNHKVEITGKDEIASLSNNFNVTVNNLRRLVQQVADSSKLSKDTTVALGESIQQTEKVSTQITAESENISTRTKNQLKDIYEMVHSINELTGEIQAVADSSEEVASSSFESSKIAKRGKDVIEGAVEKIYYLNNLITNTADVIQNLDKKTHEISEVINVITTISDKTNLLALNAAIEASSAGESGKGFSVVADEVRRLAEQTNQAANKISHMIVEIQDKTQNAVKEVTTGVQKVNEGLLAARESGATFEEINQVVESVASQIAQVTKVIERMSTRSVGIMNSLSPFIQISEESSASAANVSKGVQQTNKEILKIVQVSNKLSENAKELEQLIGEFKL